ncbi:MAG TPA: hypothetical protein PK014_11315 [Thermoanaerobaculia bacterium]|mgnify:CR=1 FL=1|nr:hypothetical protein [Thermoanaerobaculia bacterium]HUM30755.1 hypothetical protein [Thermoanaerobaculia bacterium]HXK68956.1 hypothetical protein [Thermoanaerobaculia bacterium]
MNILLILAGVLVLTIGAAHSWLGERYIIVRVLRQMDLPRLFGSDIFTRRTIRFAWHLTTIAWSGMGSVLLILSVPPPFSEARTYILLAVSLTFFMSAVSALLITRARHLSWVVFLAISTMVLAALI